MPQLSGSAWNAAASTQPVPHWVVPPGQVATHAADEHKGVATGQTVPQAPQLAPSDSVFAQPVPHAVSPA